MSIRSNPIPRAMLQAALVLCASLFSSRAMEKAEKNGVLTVQTTAEEGGKILALPGGVYAGFRPAANTFFGPVRDRLALRADDRIVLAPNQGRPVILCTSGAADPADVLSGVRWKASGKKGVLSGKARVEAKKALEIRLFAPPEPIRWVAESLTFAAADRQAGVTGDIMQTRPWLRIWIESPVAREVTWTLAFAGRPADKLAGGKITVQAKAQSPRRVDIRCRGTVGDLLVRREDGVVLPVAGGMVIDEHALPGRKTSYEVVPLSWSSAPPKVLAKVTVTTPELPPLPPLPDVYASDIKAVTFVSGWNGAPRRDLSIEDHPIRIRGDVFKKGLGTHAKSEIAYKVLSNYRRFVAVVGVDDEKDGQGTVTFTVLADDKPLIETGPVTARQERVGINVEIPKGTKRLRLLVGDAGDGVGCDHADWANAGFITEGEPRPEELLGLWLKEGFVPLFDGKNLAAWDGDRSLWSVRDGAIVGELKTAAGSGGKTCLVWRGGTPANFILTFKFRLDKGNSGVQYRSSRAAGGRVAGYQADLLTDPARTGLLYEEGGRGELAAVGQFVHVAADGTKQVLGSVCRPSDGVIADGWNTCTIMARGAHVVQAINGVPRIELIDEDPKAARSGVIALQLHPSIPTKVAFKEIQMKPLAATYGVPIRLFDGKSLRGWMPSSPKLKNTWGVKDGVLTDTGKPAGYLRTTADYTNYVLRVQLRHLKPGNSGVLLRMTGPDKVWPRSIECQGEFHNMGDIWNIDRFPMKTDPSRTQGRHTTKMCATNEGSVGTWAQYDITLDGGNLEIRVNDLLQNTATECWETPGKICLQAEGVPMEFRNITLIPIESKTKE